VKNLLYINTYFFTRDIRSVIFIMAEKINQEFEELIKLGEKAGISELMEVYGNFQEYIDASAEYFELFEPKFLLSTTDFTYITKEENVLFR